MDLAKSKKKEGGIAPPFCNEETNSTLNTRTIQSNDCLIAKSTEEKGATSFFWMDCLQHEGLATTKKALINHRFTKETPRV